MDVIAGLRDRDGQAADKISADTQVRLEDTQNLLKIPKSECPDFWIRVGDPVVPLERNFYGHPLAGLLWERQFEEVLLELEWGQNTELGMSFCSTTTRVILIGKLG